jgi:hypothetical protein
MVRVGCCDDGVSRISIPIRELLGTTANALLIRVWKKEPHGIVIHPSFDVGLARLSLKGSKKVMEGFSVIRHVSVIDAKEDDRQRCLRPVDPPLLDSQSFQKAGSRKNGCFSRHRVGFHIRMRIEKEKVQRMKKMI